MQLPFFTLYGLIGCPHCRSAEQFLKARNIPVLLMIANDDPVIAAGVKQITGKDEFPVLVSRLPNMKEVKSGFVEEDYERFAKSFYSLNGAGSSSLFASQQQPVASASVQA